MLTGTTALLLLVILAKLLAVLDLLQELSLQDCHNQTRSIKEVEWFEVREIKKKNKQQQKKPNKKPASWQFSTMETMQESGIFTSMFCLFLWSSTIEM